MTREEIRNEVADYIVSALGVKDDIRRNGVQLSSYMDSLDDVMLVMWLEQQYGIQIPDIPHWNFLDDVVDVVEENVNRQPQDCCNLRRG